MPTLTQIGDIVFAEMTTADQALIGVALGLLVLLAPHAAAALRRIAATGRRRFGSR